MNLQPHLCEREVTDERAGSEENKTQTHLNRHHNYTTVGVEELCSGEMKAGETILQFKRLFLKLYTSVFNENEKVLWYLFRPGF